MQKIHVWMHIELRKYTFVENIFGLIDSGA